MRLQNDAHSIISLRELFVVPVFEAMESLPRSMASSLVALPRSCHDLAMILARMPWPCKIVQRLTMINHDLGKGSMVTLANFLENSELLFSNCN